MAAVKKILISVAAVAATVYLNSLTGGGFTIFGSKFLALAIGSVVIAAGTAALTALFLPRSNAPSADGGKVNVRLLEPERWINAGLGMQGGGALFGEYDSAGNFWYLIVHSDSPLYGTDSYYFDDIKLTLDASGNVTNNDFCLTSKKEPYTGSGTRVPYFQIWTTTYTASNPTPPRIAALDAAFPSKWTSDHRLVGTTFSVVKIKAIDVENRYKIFRWRGAFGLGEPSISIVGKWSAPFDPRTGQYAYTQNNALIWAWFRTQRYGRNKPASSINWDRVAEQANICDQMVTGISGMTKRYQCSASIVESKQRSTAENEILASCDGQIVFDDDGKSWLRVGYYEVPTLHMTRNRDIVAMESIEAQDGESETQGVIVRYIEPEANYSAQPSAPWYNPLYYKPGEKALFLTVDILSCQNHNQAMRLAKAIGMRSQPAHKIAPTTGLRGLRARQERFLNLEYDNTFAGDYEICTPVEVQDVGLFCGFGMVPVDANRWTLLAGEEKAKPVIDNAPVAAVIAAPTGVAVTYDNSNIKAVFDIPPRDDVRYEFQYITTAALASDQWSDMAVDMVNRFAISGTVDKTVEYKVRWRTLTSSGTPTAWSTNYTVGAVPDPNGQPTSLSYMANGADTMVTVRNPTNASFQSIVFYRGPNPTFANAVAISGNIVGGLGEVKTFNDVGHRGEYYWVQAFENDGTSTLPTGPIVEPVPRLLAGTASATSMAYIGMGGRASAASAATGDFSTGPMLVMRFGPATYERWE